jgi:hypothetical protein
MIERFTERAKGRDPVLEQDLRAMLGADGRDSSFASLMLNPSSHVENTAE